MKVKELIEKLKEFDPDLTVTHSDSEYGPMAIDEVYLNEDAYVYWDKATVLNLSGSDLTKEDIDPKYFKPQERPVHKPNPLMDMLGEQLKVIYDEALAPGKMVFFVGNPPPAKDGVVEFKVIKDRDNG